MDDTFILLHSHFGPTNIVLKKNVHLLRIEKDRVMFMETDPAVDLLDVRKYPLLQFSQAHYTKNVIIISRREFNGMLDDINIDNRKVVWMFHTTRCGSTLWSQIFNSLANWSIISESQALHNSLIFGQPEYDIEAFSKTKTFEDLVVANIKWHTLMVPEDNSIFWKMAILDYYMIPVIAKMFPNHKMLLAYRNVLPSAKSWHSITSGMNASYIALKHIAEPAIIAKHPRHVHEKLMFLWYTSGYNIDVCHAALMAARPEPIGFEWFILLWASIMTVYKDFIRHGSAKFLKVKYEDLQADTRKVIERVFEYLNIHVENIKPALEATKTDSQDGLFLDWKHRMSNPSWVRTEESVKRCNTMLQYFDFGDLDSSVTL